ncbi:hypothetical protein O181_120855 [Austropuccinia psidii MF-1]|uniref:Uncharacterized protein n=1 Tax=Austropuccinia psidii MF-1 TaxID=1389203 RepID=A0A9Q3KL13_9BASI|nr:hypothetical protein [Austropuccinia psidii MF-1]
MLSFQAVPPISIAIGSYAPTTALGIEDAHFLSAIEIFEQLKEAVPMLDTRIFQKLRENADCMRQVRTSGGTEIVDSSNCASIIYIQLFEFPYIFIGRWTHVQVSRQWSADGLAPAHPIQIKQ